MAISTPAQKPRGEASNTRSTSIAVEANGLILGRILLLMPAPRVVAVAPASAAARAGVRVGDEVLTLNGHAPKDVIQWRLLADDADVELEVRRAGTTIPVSITKRDGEPLGAEVSSALFDRVRTCDNHCSFCFIYQLPKGLRSSLYLKDDDYRLSFLYGNYTTLTRFTEVDLERVVTEGLSPLNVSIHATDPDVRAALLRNRRGATSLRWLRALLDHGMTVHGQVVVCPGVNDGAVLEDTLAGVLDEYPELASLCLVPLGVSRFNTEPDMRPHTVGEAEAVLDAVAEWQPIFLDTLARRVVYAADEYYLLADRTFPVAETYEGFPMHEDGVGMARTFEAELAGRAPEPTAVASGFFAWVDGAPAEGYRAPRNPTGAGPKHVSDRRAPTGILTGEYGARVLDPLLAPLDRDDVRTIPVRNEFFGGNIAVTGLLVGADLARVLAAEPVGHRYLLPDVCLSEGRFLDGTRPEELPRPVEIVPTNGVALREALS
jgi:putative radical SAM enzyme (TIGR03279 family)